MIGDQNVVGGLIDIFRLDLNRVNGALQIVRFGLKIDMVNSWLKNFKWRKLVEQLECHLNRSGVGTRIGTIFLHSPAQTADEGPFSSMRRQAALLQFLSNCKKKREGNWANVVRPQRVFCNSRLKCNRRM